MSGIIGYIGNKEAYPVLIHGLNRFEFRGYDSVGTAVLTTNNFHIHKHAGKLATYKEAVGEDLPKGTIGIGHSRCATHGVANDVNAHPHVSNTGQLAIVHKGIVENHASLKEQLLQEGFKFKSETDTEVLINWIEHIRNANGYNLLESIQIALNQVVGAYSLIILDRDEEAM